MIHPVTSTYSIPFITSLSSILGLPTVAPGGSRGLITPYSPSLNSLNSITKLNVGKTLYFSDEFI
jgi:hypothetical protein